MPLDVADTRPDAVVRASSSPARCAEILTPDALGFLTRLHREFDARRRELLEARRRRQERFDAGETPGFLEETRSIREADWRIAPVPADLRDRRVEITGPTDRKMVINALNSGAKVFMADFEDATSPTWANLIEGQANLKDRWAGALAFEDPNTGKRYALKAQTAVLMVRPRGWHLPERNLEVDGAPVSGSLFDFGLYLLHNARPALEAGSGPYFYLPKLETRLEARLWNDVFAASEQALDLPRGSIRATVLIETLPAAFEMDEILYELRERIVGLNCGRWDYIFSTIKRIGRRPEALTPDRSAMTMSRDFLRAYSRLLIRTCHRRGAFAMGGMAAQIPVKGDPQANADAFERVRQDKEREAGDGHDGTWVAHPDLVPVALEVFDRLMPAANQLDRAPEPEAITPADLLGIHPGPRTEAGLRENIRVGVQYLEAWLRGRGAVPLYNLMEDAATAEISRAQVWQWLKQAATLDSGVVVDETLVRGLIADEMAKLRARLGAEAFAAGRFRDAERIFRALCLSEDFEEFLTLPAYAELEAA